LNLFINQSAQTCGVFLGMEASPLTQQARPISFQPKITQLYDDLFKVRTPSKSSIINA